MLTVRREPWVAEAACRDTNTELFFPGQGEHDTAIAAAVTVCRMCPVSQECLNYAIGHGERHGIWGGATERERRRIRRQRRVSGAA